MSYLDLFKNLARQVGGTPPNVGTNPEWYSGLDSADSTGVGNGLAGCWAISPTMLQNPITGVNITAPVGILEPLPGTSRRGVPQVDHDKFRLRIVIQASSGSPIAWATIIPFRDHVPAVFRSAMAADPPGAIPLTGTSAPVLEAFITGWSPIDGAIIAGAHVVGWDFTIDCDRSAIRTMLQ